MKHLFSYSTLAFLLFISGTSKSQGKSLLWQISGNGLAQPSYVYGTVHVICASDFVINKKVLNAFGKSDKLVLEVDLTDPAELKSAQKLMTSDKLLSSSLTSDEQRELDSLLRKHFNLSLDKVQNLVPLALEQMMILKIVDCADKKMYEMEFIQKAKEQNKPVDKLETISEQFSYFEKSFTAKDVIKHMQLMPEYDKLFRQMISYYKEEDLEGLKSFASDERFMNKPAQHWLLDLRNKTWVGKMPEMMKDKAVFFAVGALHLVGENGVIALLKNEGYTVTPVMN